jgi:hypothetical protein
MSLRTQCHRATFLVLAMSGTAEMCGRWAVEHGSWQIIRAALRHQSRRCCPFSYGSFGTASERGPSLNQNFSLDRQCGSAPVQRSRTTMAVWPGNRLRNPVQASAWKEAQNKRTWRVRILGSRRRVHPHRSGSPKFVEVAKRGFCCSSAHPPLISDHSICSRSLRPDGVNYGSNLSPGCQELASAVALENRPRFRKS